MIDYTDSLKNAADAALAAEKHNAKLNRLCLEQDEKATDDHMVAIGQAWESVCSARMAYKAIRDMVDTQEMEQLRSDPIFGRMIA